MEFVPVKSHAFMYVLELYGASGRGRTGTPVKARDFKSVNSHHKINELRCILMNLLRFLLPRSI